MLCDVNSIPLWLGGVGKQVSRAPLDFARKSNDPREVRGLFGVCSTLQFTAICGGHVLGSENGEQTEIVVGVTSIANLCSAYAFFRDKPKILPAL